jgi:hypothetical protein
MKGLAAICQALLFFRDAFVYNGEPKPDGDGSLRDMRSPGPVSIRPDLVAAHERAWQRIARPGTWLDGATRVAIAAETRHAASCLLCRGPSALATAQPIGGEHTTLGGLSAALVDVVHRVRTDPGGLSRAWFDGVIARGVSAEQYVETLGVIAQIVAIDTMTRALGLALPPLPQPLPGAPSQRRPTGAKPGAAWVPWLDPADAVGDDAGLYPSGRPAANIMKAMSLVPDEVRGFFDLVAHQYLPGPAMRDFAREYRAISHPQIELLAARVSALNQCLY